MDARTVLAVVAAAAVGGAAVLAWPRFGPCLTGRQEVELRAGQSTAVGCEQLPLSFERWSAGAELRLHCPSVTTARLSEASPSAEICGLMVTLLDHSVDPRVGGDQVRLAVAVPESE